MENIKISRMIQEYFRDFIRNFNKIPGQSLPVIYIIPLWVASLGLPLFAFIFILFPCIFCALSAGTHLQIYPQMFYLLPMTGTQREQYGKRTMAIRTLLPGILVFLWSATFAAASEISAGSAAMLTISCALYCFFMQAAAAEGKEENSVVFGMSQVALTALSALSLKAAENSWALAAAAAIFIVAIPAAVKMGKRYSSECRSRMRYERAGQKKGKQ